MQNKYLEPLHKSFIINRFHHTKRTHIHLVTTCFLILLSLIPACKHEPIPQYLIGMWITSSPNYFDRYLKITEHEIVYGVGDGMEYTSTIEKFDIKKDSERTKYIFYYRGTEGEKETLTVFIENNSYKTLKIVNIEDIWEKIE